VINSPKVTSVKFWPGCFGIFSTHCVLQAKTTVKGKSIGIQTFILPMRDM
jgi:acyl-CoA oxidase